MSNTPRLTGHKLVALAAALGFFGAAAPNAWAQQVAGPSESQIVEALTPKPLTRSLSMGSPTAAQGGSSDEAAFIESLRKTRSLSSAQREKLATVAEGKPSIDLEIPFALGSAAITPKNAAMVDRLGAALSRAELKQGTYVIAGHTDARGSAPLNQSLSERRAESVKRYLVEKHKLPADNLIAVGYGKNRLKNKDVPTADENRRVQATNLSEVKSASR